MGQESDVTILRDAQGAAQHAVLRWEQFQTLVRAAEGEGTMERVRAAVLPAPVGQGIAGGAHPIRAWRDFRGLNQAQLAGLAGISRAYLAQIEGGERTGTLEVTARIARALGCLIEQLMAPVDDFAARVAALAAMPSKMKDVVRQVPHEAWARKPANGGFSLLEHVCHLRDIDGDGYRERVERMLTEERPSLPELDGDALAVERDYPNQDLGKALSSFTATRWQIAARLARLTPEERGRSGLQAGVGEITIEGLVGAMLAHDSAHLDEMTELSES
jgi:transcriptional regulator with XRE-family HTH domain